MKADKLVFLSCAISLIIAAGMIFIYDQERFHVDIREISSLDSEIISKNSAEAFSTTDIEYEIESCDKTNDGGLLVTGWFIEKGVTYSFNNYGLDWYGESVYDDFYLCIIDADNVYIFPTKLFEREDITEKIDDGIVYGKCGFKAFIAEKYVDLYEEADIGVIVNDPYGGEKIYEISK